MGTRMNKLLFVCTGNFYRSRLAELLFNHYAGQKGVPWEAESRGLMVDGSLRGISPSVVHFLQQNGLEHLLSKSNPPQALKVDELESCSLIIGMSRAEHEPMFKNRFGAMPRALVASGKLRFWNICDLPVPRGIMGRLFMDETQYHFQNEESGTEHVHFAVKSLIYELADERFESRD